MKSFTIIIMILIASVSFAQNQPIDFEPGGHGAEWTWTVFENVNNPPLEIIDNPDPSGINTSATVAKFTALEAGQPWAGVESQHGVDLGTFEWNNDNRIVTIQVWKPVISNVGIKFATETGWAEAEILVSNTVTNEWEELTFDFSNAINPPDGNGSLGQIIIFPDFANRDQDNVIYFDNITFHPVDDDPPVDGPDVAAPTPPALDPDDVISIFSDAFANVEGTDFNPPWGQSTQVSIIDIEGSSTLKYANFNYQGTQFASPLNVSEMEYIHLDMWTADATSVNFFIISPGPVETPFSLPVTPNEWVGYDIPLSEFDPVDLTDVIQFKFDGGDGSQTIYLDNIYFYTGDLDDEAGPNQPIDFEPGGHGAEWTWTVFENVNNPPLEIIDNPDPSGINTSATVAKFTALEAGQPWAGVESQHGVDLGTFEWNNDNRIVTIQVWKPVISNVGIKFATETGWAEAEILVSNTVTNEWEELTFDFSNAINPPDGNGTLGQIIIFPDFANRDQDNVIYFDNITFHPVDDDPPVDGPDVAAPTPPALDPDDVISIFSDAFANVEGTDFNPPWGQSTQVSIIDIEGSSTLKYANFNYQGTQFASPLNVSEMEYIHLDMWTADATSVNFFIISPGPVETPFSLPITPNQWVSYDIPLSEFDPVDLTDVIQFKFDGGDGTQTIYLDNIYFYAETPAVFTVIFDVVDEFGFAIEDAVIVLGPFENEPGDYVFHDVPAGTHEYTVTAPCFFEHGDEIIVDGDMEHEVVLELNIMPGDANGDGVVNVLDVILIAQHYAGNIPDNFCFHNADVNEDGAINVLDIILTINIFSADKLAPYGDLNSEDAHIFMNEFGIQLHSDGTLAGIQFEITGDVAGMKLKLELPNHQVVYVNENGIVRAVIFSFDNTPLPAGLIDLVSFDRKVSADWLSVKAGNLNGIEVPVVISDDEITGIDEVDVSFTAYPNPVRSGELVTLSTLAKQVDVFDMAGKLVQSFVNTSSVETNQMNRGVYLMRVKSDNGHVQISRLIVK